MKICTKGLIVTIATTLLSVAAQGPCFAGSATWSSNPVSNNWNTAENWMPNSVPNGPSDVASFGSSGATGVRIASTVEVSSVRFMPSASPFTISVEGVGINLLITSDGLSNDSGISQSFTAGPQSAIFFFDDATAGEMTSFLAVGGEFLFLESSSAGSASFDISNSESSGGEVEFFDTSTAADSTITLTTRGGASFGDTATAANAVITATTGGFALFGTSSSAGKALITLSGDSHVSFTQSATADHAHFTAGGATSSSEPGAVVNVGDSTTAGEATFVLEGGSVTGAPGALMTFFNSGRAGNASITVNGGTSGGKGALVLFQAESDGGTASFALFGDGKLDFSKHQPGVVTVGSVEGDGQVVLGATALAVGSNHRSTTFSGVIEDGQITGGSLSKIGSGVLKLSGANTYTGGTTLSEGGLLIRNTTGSGTGTGPVQVNGRTLAGAGVIAGAVTIGSGSGPGAVLSPGQGASKPARLTLQSSLTFKADATYRYRLNLKKAKSDLVTANGVTIESGAQFNFQAISRGRLRPGKVATVISNTAATPIAGTFANLPEGATLSAGGNALQVSYQGGDGNDLTLTVLP